jgi:DNA transposition AAA+ family ATPase
MTNEIKQKILDGLKESRVNFSGSDAKFAKSLGINAGQYSRIMRGEFDRVLSDAGWISIARKLKVNLSNAPVWMTANTPVYQFITAQLSKCQSESLSSLLCDLSDIGKTYAAQKYALSHRNVVYIDCSQVKSKQRMIRRLAREFGLDSTGRYIDVYEDLVYYLKTLDHPLVIFDEAGDLYYEAFLEIKALWNATELACGFYMMGADGLKEKIRRAIDNKKVGYTELFSRFGKRYINVVPEGGDEGKMMMQATAAMIIKANASQDVDVNVLLKQTLGEDGMPSLRRIYKVLSKVSR